MPVTPPSLLPPSLTLSSTLTSTLASSLPPQRLPPPSLLDARLLPPSSTRLSLPQRLPSPSLLDAASSLPPRPSPQPSPPPVTTPPMQTHLLLIHSRLLICSSPNRFATSSRAPPLCPPPLCLGLGGWGVHAQAAGGCAHTSGGCM